MAGSIRDSRGVDFDKMRVLGSYALVYLTAGSGRFQLAGREPRPCRAGDLLILFPELAHAYGPGADEKWDEIYVVFDGAVFDLWRQCGILSSERPILRLQPVDAFARSLARIVRMRSSGSATQALRQVCQLQSWIAEAFSRQSPSPGVHYNPWPAWTEEAIRRMEGEPSLPLTELARECGFGYESFRKKFRAVTGVSPGAYRDRLAMDLARKWIYEEGLSNKEIADRLDYCDEFHFSRRFRALTGKGTREFRASVSHGK